MNNSSDSDVFEDEDSLQLNLVIKSISPHMIKSICQVLSPYQVNPSTSSDDENIIATLKNIPLYEKIKDLTSTITDAPKQFKDQINERSSRLMTDFRLETDKSFKHRRPNDSKLKSQFDYMDMDSTRQLSKDYVQINGQDIRKKLNQHLTELNKNLYKNNKNSNCEKERSTERLTLSPYAQSRSSKDKKSTKISQIQLQKRHKDQNIIILETLSSEGKNRQREKKQKKRENQQNAKYKSRDSQSPKKSPQTNQFPNKQASNTNRQPMKENSNGTPQQSQSSNNSYRQMSFLSSVERQNKRQLTQYHSYRNNEQLLDINSHLPKNQKRLPRRPVNVTQIIHNRPSQFLETIIQNQPVERRKDSQCSGQSTPKSILRISSNSLDFSSRGGSLQIYGQQSKQVRFNFNKKQPKKKVQE